jgi:hypothetical protein
MAKELLYKLTIEGTQSELDKLAAINSEIKELQGGLKETESSPAPSVTRRFVGASGATGGVAATTEPSVYAIT